MSIPQTACDSLREQAKDWARRGSPRAALAATYLAQFVPGADRFTRERMLPQERKRFQEQFDEAGETCPTPFQEVFDLYLAQAEVQAAAGRRRYAADRMIDFLRRFADAPDALIQAAGVHVERFNLEPARPKP